MDKAKLTESFMKHGVRRGYPHRYQQLYRDITERLLYIRSILHVGPDVDISLLAWQEAYPNAKVRGANPTTEDVTHRSLAEQTARWFDPCTLIIDSNVDAAFETRVETFINLFTYSKAYVIETIDGQQLASDYRGVFKQHGVKDIKTYTSAAHRNYNVEPYLSLVVYNPIHT